MIWGNLAVALRRLVRPCACAVLCLFLAHCANSGRIGGSSSALLVAPGEPVPKGGGTYHVGQPYVVAGRTYVPAENPNYRAEGEASWYGSDFHGRETANGEIFDANSLSAAHATLPLPSYVRVTNLGNRRSLILRVNDRGPFARNRIIDVSRRAAHLLGFTARGTAWVRVEYVGRAPIEGSDDRVLEATYRENEPAPAPADVRLAGLPGAPNFPPQPPPVRNQRLASVVAGDSADDAGPDAAPAKGSQSADGTAQFLNGRGLY